ncbi:MAG: hypothetical protein ACYC7A_21285 [Thermoanaerobaculia bacterium]
MKRVKKHREDLSTPLSREEASEVSLLIEGALLSVRSNLDSYAELARNVDLLNASSPSFFALVGSLLVGDAIRTICRVTDEAFFRGRQPRVTVKYLAHRTKGAPSLDAVKGAVTPLRELRDNWISHADLATALAETRATVTLKAIESADREIRKWLTEFARLCQLPTEPVDQGTWRGVKTLIAALRDADAVRTAYRDLLDWAASSDTPRAIDARLTEQRREYETYPFSELAWLFVRRAVLQRGLADVRRSLDPFSPYAAIVIQAEDPSGDVTKNWTDRRLAERIRREAAWLLRDL